MANKALKHHFVLAALGVVAGGLALPWVIGFFTPPVTNVRVENVLQNVKPFEEFVSRVFRDKWREDCPLSPSYTLTAHPSTSASYEVEKPKITTRVLGTKGLRQGLKSKSFVDVAYTIRMKIDPGRYSIQTTLRYKCRERTFVIKQPPFFFNVV